MGVANVVAESYKAMQWSDGYHVQARYKCPCGGEHRVNDARYLQNRLPETSVYVGLSVVTKCGHRLFIVSGLEN